MANPTVPTADIYRCLKMMLKALGLTDPRDSTGLTAMDGGFLTKKECLDRILLADMEIRILIANTLSHPFRNALSVAISDTITCGGNLPPSLAAHKKVLIVHPDGSPSRLGDLAQHVDLVRTLQQDAAMSLDYWDKYFIDNGRVELGHLSATALITLFDLTINRTANTNDGSISSPVNYEYAVACRAIIKSIVRNQNLSDLQIYAQENSMYENEIKAGNTNLPKSDIMLRLTE